MSQPFYKIGFIIFFISIIAFMILYVFKPQTQLENSIWKNTEIPEYVIEFKNNDVFIEHGSTESFTGTWTYRTPDLVIKLEDETYRYSVITLSKKELLLNIYGSSEKLSFTPMER